MQSRELIMFIIWYFRKVKYCMYTDLHLSLGSFTFNYISENLLCLFYGIDVLATRYAFFASYHDLLVDIAESFGVWVALLTLVISSTTVLVCIQQTLSFSWEASSKTVGQVSTASLATAYQKFTSFFSTK